jgi:hypothetical protein
MYINKISINNIRSISSFEMKFDNPAGWHVIIGDNGTGKSTIIRSIVLGILGPYDSKALRLNLNEWINKTTNGPYQISLNITKSDIDSKSGKSQPRKSPFYAIVSIEKSEDSGQLYIAGNGSISDNNIWSNTYGWFSCAFGPFRRFKGGNKDWDVVYYSDPRTAAHLSGFGEDVALTEANSWLQKLFISKLESNQISRVSESEESLLLELLETFLNNSELLPHKTKLKSITSESVFFEDGNGAVVEMNQLSDGYRSILSLTFELIRQMIRSYGFQKVSEVYDKSENAFKLPGVILIDEIDAHLHPSWQAKIGDWFLKVFPNLQFIVTTHSPLICRASEKGSVWRLRAPGTEYASGEVTGVEKDRLIYGDLLDAYGTELFGKNITQSQSGQQLTEKLAILNMKSFKTKLSAEEQKELEELKNITTSISDAAIKR